MSPPRVVVIAFYEVPTGFVERNITALTRVTRDTWDTQLTDLPTWMRAQNVIDIMSEVGIDPVTQHLDGLIHLLMATPGPKEGAPFGARVDDKQEREARKHIRVEGELLLSRASDAMVTVLNSKEAPWLHLSILDIHIAGHGVYQKQDYGAFMGVYMQEISTWATPACCSSEVEHRTLDINIHSP